MKTILLSLAFAIGLGANAQSTDHPKKTAEEKAERRTERMMKDLDLEAGQKARVSAINLFYAKAMKDVETITDDASRENREKVLKGKRDNGLQEVLTPEQYRKMLSLRAEKKAKHQADKKDKKVKSDD